ncbi:hypothetical protein BDV97DRAFT_111825 [Delphinella strobiligena]|nr:hypothetical protein BDV97DRAFT_111825 [Delphinella strobiligena]
MSNQTKQSVTSVQGHAGQLQFLRRPRVQATVPHHRSNYFVHHPRKVESRRQGYPRLAAFVNSDKDFVVFRGFGELQARILLYKQDEIVLLEERLHSVDSNETSAYNLNARRHDQNVERRDLVSEIRVKAERVP